MSLRISGAIGVHLHYRVPVINWQIPECRLTTTVSALGLAHGYRSGEANITTEASLPSSRVLHIVVDASISRELRLALQNDVIHTPSASVHLESGASTLSICPLR